MNEARVGVARAATEARLALHAARNHDGGWPYAPGKRSRIEPTCLALLATADGDAGSSSITVLRNWPRAGGWMIDVQDGPPNHAFNAIAALTLLQHPEATSLAEPLIRRLIAAKGLRLPPTDAVEQDGSLQAWSWVEGTASWVEPTAWSLLLLKKCRTQIDPSGISERIAVGEQMLIDRVCRGGGWNYGNPRVYGRDLWAYVPTTALALLALQDRRDLPAVQRSLEQLLADVQAERSALALGLAIICLRVYGVPCETLLGSLAALPGATGRGKAMAMNIPALAVTVSALDESPAALAAFSL